MNIIKAILMSVAFLLPMLTYAIGGNDPIDGIDIIIKKNPGSRPITNFSLGDKSVIKANALQGERRSSYLTKIILAQLNKKTEGQFKGKEWQTIFFKNIATIKCYSCEKPNSYTFITTDSKSKQSYSIQLKIQPPIKVAKPFSQVGKASVESLQIK